MIEKIFDFIDFLKGFMGIKLRPKTARVKV